MPPPELIIADDEEVRPLAALEGRQFQKHRNERKRRLQLAASAGLAARSGYVSLYLVLKKNALLVLLVVSAFVNVVFLWEKAGLLLDDNEDESDIEQKAHRGALYPNSQYEICQKLPFSTPQQIWAEHLGEIFHGSRLPSDHDDILHDLRAQMLAMISPKLPLSVKTLDKDWKTVAAIMEKGWKRWEYLQHSQDIYFDEEEELAEEEPPIKIVVMGGSVAFGEGCKSGVRFHDQKTCSWPYRLNVMLNDLFGDVIRVSNLAVGGTNTAVGTKILQYDTLAKETDQADILINAYATNDNLEEEEDIFEMIQSFCRQVFQPHPCKFLSKPLLIYLNDALGDDQKPLMESTSIPGVIEVLSNYYGFGSISYVDVVKQWVYGDSVETWFSPDAHWGDTMPGQGMHITAAWIVSFYFLSLVTNFCSLESWDVLHSQFEYNPELLPPGLPEIRNATDIALQGKPRSPPLDMMPPPLDAKMTIHDVSVTWANSKPPKTKKCNNREPGYKTCPFSWVSDHGAIGNAWLRENILDKTVENSDWIMEPPHVTKPGFRSPDGAKVGSHMTIEFGGQPHPINRVVVLTHMGHSEKWINSMGQIEILAASGEEWEELGIQVVKGYQNRTTSRMAVQDIDLSREIATGDKLRIRTTLIGGNLFKLTGLALCSS
jgi:hypothetical protein